MDTTEIENSEVDAHDDLDGRMECEGHREDDMESEMSEAETENHANARNDIANNYNDGNWYLDRW